MEPRRRHERDGNYSPSLRRARRVVAVPSPLSPSVVAIVVSLFSGDFVREFILVVGAAGEVLAEEGADGLHGMD